jgi:amidohydrolase
MLHIDPEFSEWISKLRRDFHMHPELSTQEYWTTKKIFSILNEWGIETKTFTDTTGLVALVKGNRPGPTLAFRADLDALPIEELNTVPYSSRNKNMMHACGHDANTAIMLGVARAVVENNLQNQIRGNIKFIFQPAEEKTNGAESIIAQGVLENPNVDWVIAGHMAPDLDVGQIGIFEKYGYASADRFILTISGKGGHAGRPHETIDPILCGAQFITEVQTIISRSVDPVEPVVISVGKFQAGDVGNVIPEKAILEGTIRTHSDDIRKVVFTRLESIIEGMQKQSGAKCNLDIIDETPPCNCDQKVSEFMFNRSTEIVGKKNVTWLPPTMGSEDFAFFAKKRPATIIRLGCRNKGKNINFPLHSPYFDIDESVLDIGVRVFYQAISSYYNI